MKEFPPFLRRDEKKMGWGGEGWRDIAQNELKIRSLAKGRRQCGNGDFPRMKNILNNHGEKMG